MDIINVVSVTSQAQVKQWYEENDEEIQNALYWRQAFDVRTYELSVCSCTLPALSLLLIALIPPLSVGRTRLQLQYAREPRQDADRMHNGSM